MQTKRFVVLVGTLKTEEFEVPQGLLSKYSPVFDSMCRLPFEEAETRFIKLPEECQEVFRYFFLWVHSLVPALDTILPGRPGLLLNLAIFAEKYQISLLKNQTADMIQTRIYGEAQSKAMVFIVDPMAIGEIYSKTPQRSILRRLCMLSLTTELRSFKEGRIEASSATAWENLICKHPDIGWDFFRKIQTREADSIRGWGPSTFPSDPTHACTYHDYSDIPGFKEPKLGAPCPYPLGVPSKMTQKSTPEKASSTTLSTAA